MKKTCNKDWCPKPSAFVPWSSQGLPFLRTPEKSGKVRRKPETADFPYSGKVRTSPGKSGESGESGDFFFGCSLRNFFFFDIQCHLQIKLQLMERTRTATRSATGCPFYPSKEGFSVSRHGSLCVAQNYWHYVCSGVTEVRADAMWCKFCHVLVSYRDKSSANYHVKSAGHKKALSEKPTYVQTPGSSAAVLAEPPASEQQVASF